MKYQLLLSYIINLAHIMYRKISGKNIQEDTSVERLVEIRTVSIFSKCWNMLEQHKNV